MKRWLARLILAAVLIIIVRFAVVYIALTPVCGNTVVKEMVSPDGKYVAVVFDRDCGATTSFERIVMLRQRSDKLNPNDYQEWIFTAPRQPQVEISWANSTRLVIRSNSSGESNKPADHWRDVQIAMDSMK
jgi:hypothetical protein